MKSRKQRALLRWMWEKKVFSTHEVLEWGIEHFYNRADRTKRDFVERGYIRPLGKFEKVMQGSLSREGMYEVNASAMADLVSEIILEMR